MKNKLAFLWIALALIIFKTTSELRHLKTEYSVEQFYPKDHQLLKDHDNISRIFRLNSESPYMIALEVPEKKGWLKPERIKKLKELSHALQDRKDVKQIVTMTTIEGASINDQEMIVGNIFERVQPEGWEKAVLQNPLLYPLLITKDFSTTLLIVEASEKSREQLSILESDFHSLIKSYFPEAKIHAAGVPLLQRRLSTIIQSELGLFLLYIGIAFCGVFYLLFSHWTAIASALVTLLCSNIFGLGLMVAFDIPMNALLVTLPVIISVSIMSLLIHTLHLWSSKKFHGKSFEIRTEIAFETLKELFLPNALGILTTALGFATLAPSAIPLISEYGLIVSAILACVALMAQVMMFLLLPYVTPKMKAWLDKPAFWSLIAFRYPVPIVSGITILSIFGATLIPKLNFSFQLFDDLPANDEIRKTTNWIDKSFGGIISYDVEAKISIKDFWRNPENLKKLSALSENLRHNPQIRTVISAADFFQSAIPETNEQIGETFFIFSMAEKNPLISFMTEDGRSTRLAIRLSDISSDQLSETKAFISSECQRAFPDVTFTDGGMASYAHAINQEVARALIYDFWHPLLLIGLFLVFIFRSFKWALLSCIPNFIPPMFLVTSLALSGQPVKPGIALIFAIAMGFAFNNTLYILSRLKSLEKNHKKSHALERALLMEANPCLLESFVMFVGFSIFLFSEFNMNQTFGGFMLISIMAGFVADLVFLPAFLKLCPAVYKNDFKIPVRVLSLVVLAGLSSAAVAGPEAKDILKKSQKLLESKDDEASVEMIIIEQNGENKSRSLSLKTLRNSGFFVIARIEAPADIKDMSFLGHVDEEGNEKQWIYLPSSGQVRRLVTGKTKSGVLGSEISPEDLNSEAIKAANVKLQKTDGKFYWIELTPSPGSSEYTKVITKISIDDSLPKFTAYFINDKMKKTVAFKDYKKIGPVFRAHQIKVQNHLNGRQTEVRLTSVKVNAGLSEDDFTQSSLKN